MDSKIQNSLFILFAPNGFKCFRFTSAEEALETLDEHVGKVDSMLIDEGLKLTGVQW